MSKACIKCAQREAMRGRRVCARCKQAQEREIKARGPRLGRGSLPENMPGFSKAAILNRSYGLLAQTGRYSSDELQGLFG